jgi:hypothetical protein
MEWTIRPEKRIGPPALQGFIMPTANQQAYNHHSGHPIYKFSIFSHLFRFCQDMFVEDVNRCGE